MSRRSIGFRILVLLACLVLGAVAGFAFGLFGILGDRCAGPACAGIIIIPFMTAVPGAAVGLIVGAVLWLRGRHRERLTV